MPQFTGIWSLTEAQGAVRNQNWPGIAPPNIEYLIVAGGGGGGTDNGGAGGGAGGTWNGSVYTPRQKEDAPSQPAVPHSKACCASLCLVM